MKRGVVSSYDAEAKRGNIILDDGEVAEFKLSQWANIKTPAVTMRVEIDKNGRINVRETKEMSYREILNDHEGHVEETKEQVKETKEYAEEQSDNKENSYYGVISFVLSILGFFTLPLILAPIAFYLGIKANSESIFGKIGAILSAFLMILMLLAALLGITIIAI